MLGKLEWGQTGWAKTEKVAFIKLRIEIIILSQVGSNDLGMLWRRDSKTTQILRLYHVL